MDIGIQAMDDDAVETMELTEILGWAEFGAWSALVMTPIIWWLQGPSVSTDQFVVRTGLIVISAGTAVALRARALVQRRRDAKKPLVGHASDQRPEPAA